ncbi:MAG TPA: hypothetical protein VK742_11365 [Candidatus Sulfotelmatobacter sp.]|jgi:hypothetical protein|nr:hypothetical protein [Candidatus Sulfotelmatobacter sp.]
MIEVWFDKAWKRSTSARGRLARFVKELPSKRTGIVLTIAMPALVLAWHLVVVANRPAHFNKIMAALGSSTIGHFGFSMADNTGTRLVFMQAVENGYGLFLSKIGGKRKLIDVDPYTLAGPLHEMLLDWSPDSRFFAYCRYKDHWEVVICDGDTGAMVAAVPVTDRCTLGTWLSPETLALADDGHAVFTISHAQGAWSNPVPFKSFKLPAERVQGFTRFDDHSIVWKQGNAIWRCSEGSDAPVKVWDSSTIQLMEFCYSPAANRFLLHGQDANGQFLADLYPDRSSELTGITKIDTSELHPESLRLINEGKGYAFISQIGTTNLMVTKLDEAHAPVTFQWPDQYSHFVPGQHEIFVTSSINHGPTGIWKYDVASGSVACVVPRADDAYYLTNATVEWHQVTNASGKILTYYLYVPPRQITSKKRPLIMGIAGVTAPGFAWNADYQSLADCGYYFMYTERNQRNEAQWGKDLFSAYESLTKNPDIDTNQVYLCAASAGADPVCDLLVEYPKLWRGIVLHSPLTLPDLSQLSGKKVFIDYGDLDLAINSYFNPARFQDQAANAGVPITLLCYPWEEHIVRMLPSERERSHETLLFLNEP